MADRASLIPNAGGTPYSNSPSPQPNFQQQQSGTTQPPQPELTILQRSSHPAALVFHLLFRVLAIVMFMLPTFIDINFILAFILIVLLLSFDFWTVKNVSGRLLVGLRWWNDIQDNTANNATDSRVFWYSLYLTQAFWILFAIIQLLKLSQYFVVTLVALSLNSSNIIGYTKCEKDAKKKLQGFATQTLLNNFNPLSYMFGGSGSK